MSASGNESLAREVYRSLAGRNCEAAAERAAEDVVVLNVATGELYRGTAGFLEYFRGWSVAFPDLRFELMKLVGGAERAVVEYEMRGTHTGPFVTRRGHVPPTGMEVQLRFCDVLEVREERIAHLRSYFDSVTLLRQLGLIASTPLHAPERRAPLELYAQAVEGHAPLRHKVVVQRYLQDVYNRQSPAAVVDTCARSFTWHGGALGEARGLPAYQHVLTTFFAAFPDLQIEILDSVAEGDRVSIRISMSGTHLGEFQGIAPTYKRVTGGGTSTYRLEESRIVEEWWQWDMLVLLQQMDAAPSTVRIGS